MSYSGLRRDYNADLDRAPPRPMNQIHEDAHAFGVLLSGQFSLPTMAMAAQDEYLAKFPPETYGTRFVAIMQVGSQFVVAGSRHPSCQSGLDTPALQRLRNRLGPSILSKLTAAEIHQTALEIARNLFALSSEPVRPEARP